MSDYKSRFQRYTSEHLLQMRAKGSELSDAAHRAIEEVFQERGEALPPRPSRPIDVHELTKSERSRGNVWLNLVVVVLGLLVAKMLSKAIGVVLLAVYAIYRVLRWFRERRLGEAERNQRREAREIEAEGLGELMVCAANGDVSRIRELVAYGADVNATTLKDHTALMYAVRNNQLAAVEALLNLGASLTLKSDSGESALQIAQRFGHAEVAALLMGPR